MFTNAPYWIVVSKKVYEMHQRKIQMLKLRIVGTQEYYSFHIPHKIDISQFEKWDSVQLELSVRVSGSLKNPQFYISNVMLLNNEDVMAIDARRAEHSPLH